MTDSFQIPVELMKILTEINDNVNEVKNRLTRLEALDHANEIKEIRQELKQERDKRVELQLELNTVKTRLAPILMGISIVVASFVQFMFSR